VDRKLQAFTNVNASGEREALKQCERIDNKHNSQVSMIEMEVASMHISDIVKRNKFGHVRGRVGCRFSDAATKFLDLPLEKASDWATGYLPAFRHDLGLDVPGGPRNRKRILLDYGCGKGAVAHCLVHELQVGRVLGLDINPTCLNQARSLATTSDEGRRMSFALIGREAEALLDNTFDGAMCNFVLSVLKTSDEQLVILRNVWKALVPGAPFVVLVNNPQSVGTRFSSIQMGDPETIYAPGQLVGVQMFRVDTGEMFFETRDRWWPIEVCAKRLTGDTLSQRVVISASHVKCCESLLKQFRV